MDAQTDGQIIRTLNQNNTLCEVSFRSYINFTKKYLDQNGAERTGKLLHMLGHKNNIIKQINLINDTFTYFVFSDHKELGRQNGGKLLG